jgi:undecaprenyl-diphosphatase
VVLAAVAGVLLTLLALAISHDAVQDRDLSLLRSLHDTLVSGGVIKFADEAADWVSVWLGPGPHLLPVTLGVAFLAWRQGRLRLAVFVPLAFAAGLVGERVLKIVLARPRPNLYPDMALSTGPSFPSGHAVGAICAVAVPVLVMAWLARRTWLRVSLVVLAVLLVVAIDLARLVLAVHWPTDVLAGNLLGIAICGVLAAALGLPGPGAMTRPGRHLFTAWWQRVDPERPGGDVDSGVEGNRRLTSVTGAVQVGVLTVVILSGVVFGSVPWLHFVSGFVAIPLTLLKLGSTGYRFVHYYVARSQPFRAAGPPTWLPRLLAPVLVASAVVALVTGSVLFFQGTTHGTWASLHTDSAVVFIVAVIAHLAVHARTSYLATAAELRRPRSVEAPRGLGTRRAAVLGACVAGLLLGAGLVLAYPWNA